MTKVYCRVLQQGMHSFYLNNDGKNYFLFSQAYRKGVQDYFSRGVSIDKSVDFSKTHGDDALIKTMTKIPMYIKYAEREFGLAVLRKTQKQKKNQQNDYLYSAV